MRREYSDSGRGDSRLGSGVGGGLGALGSNYPDSQQIFVGNLPHTVSESDLESLFGEYGKVTSLRHSFDQFDHEGCSKNLIIVPLSSPK